MPISAGALNRRILIERKVPGAKDGHGHPVELWTTLVVCRARVVHGTGAERRTAAQESGTAPATFEVRRTSVTRTVTPADRLRFDPTDGSPVGAPLWDISSAAPFEDDAWHITATMKPQAA